MRETWYCEFFLQPAVEFSQFLHITAKVLVYLIEIFN